MCCDGVRRVRGVRGVRGVRLGFVKAANIIVQFV